MLKVRASSRRPQGAAVLAALVLAASAARADVEIVGLPDELLESVRASVSLDSEPCSAPDWRVESLYRRAPAEIRDALRAFGYYDARVTATRSVDDDCWHAGFDVRLGAPVLLREVKISVAGEASSDADFDAIVNEAMLARGGQLDHGEYERVKTAIADLGQRKGYAEAEWRASRIDVYPDEGAADVTLDYDSGPRYAFGEISVDQQVLNDELVASYYDIQPGDPYDRNELTDLYGALADSGYFGFIDVRPLAADPATRRIPVAVELTPGNRKVLSYGGGFATDTGPRLRIGRSNQRVNERGAQLNMNAELSPVISEFSVTYRLPYGDPRTEWLSFNTGIKYEDTETSVSESIHLGVRQVVKRRRDWQETRFLEYSIEDYEIAEDPARSRLLMPGASWLRLRADDTIRPENGHRTMFEVSGASDMLGSDTSFLRVLTETRWIWSLKNRARVLTRVRAGLTWDSNFEELPPSVRFFAGGDQSIRGYEFRSLGPEDEEGNVIGGDRLLVGSVEYEHPLTEQWSLATFYDVGNAFDETGFDPVAGAGIGARWRSPLGPIRIDVAKPLDGAERDWRLHISLGPDL